MNTYNNNLRLLTPPREEEEVYPYRRVWRSIAITSIILLMLMIGVYVLRAFIGFDVPEQFRFIVNVALAISPALLWLIFSWLPENLAVEPRPRLMTVFVVSALVANAIGLPLVNGVLQPSAWLSQQELPNRIMGYMLTVGIVQEFLKYAVVRYIAFPRYYRVRADSVAYCAASAMGYALVVNLSYVAVAPDITIDALVMRVFATTTIQLVGSTMVAYGLSETFFTNAFAFLLPLMLFFAALFTGVAIPMRSMFMNASLGLGGSAQNSLIGMAVSIALYVSMIAMMLFFFNVADQRERDRFGEE